MANKLERITERQMTVILRRMFGGEYYALARRGDRRVCKYVDGSAFCIDLVTAKTWAEVLVKARDHFGWSQKFETPGEPHAYTKPFRTRRRTQPRTSLLKP